MDLSIFNAVHSLAGVSGITDWIGIFFAKYLPYLLAVAAFGFVINYPTWRERIWTFSYLFLTALLSRGIVTECIRFVWARPRPFVELGFTPLVSESSSSFPSGHMTFFFALAFAIFFMNRKWGIWFIVLSSVVGLARIFVGVHWPSDIIGGIIVAYLSALTVKAVLKKYEPKFETVYKNPA